MDEEYVSMLILRLLASAVIFLSMHVLHIQTNAISTIEHIVAGKYNVGDDISIHMFIFFVVLNVEYVPDGQVV